MTTSFNLTPKSAQIIFFSDVLHTRVLPGTRDILDINLPTIYNHKCQNYRNLKFKEEVRNTETGHLFEHIVLEYLFRLTKKRYKSVYNFKGRTYWNWSKNPRGLFSIDISGDLMDQEIFIEALENSKKLISKISKRKPAVV